MMIQGSIPALVTPMNLDSTIDWDGLSNLIEWHIEQGSDAIAVVGTTGESPTITPQEHIEVIRFAVEQAKGRVPIVAGSGANSTQEAIELTQAAKDVKADMSLSVVPYYNKPEQVGLYQHFVAIATSVAIPIVLYDVPRRTATELSVDTVQKLAAIDTIIGIKDATGNLQKVQALRAACPTDFALLSGDDKTFVDFLALGGVGTISVTSNVAPKQMHEIVAHMNAGNTEQAHAINQQLHQLHDALFIEASPIPVKYALYAMSKIKPALRLPLTWAAESTQQQVNAALAASGIA